MDEFSSSSSEDDLHLQNQRDRGRFRRGSEEEYQERRRRIREAQKVYPVSSSTPCGEGRYWQDVLADYLKVQRRNSGKLSIIGDEPNHTDSGSPIVQRAASIRMVTAEEEAAKQAAMQTPELDKTPAKPSIAVDGPETSDQETNTTKRITHSSSTTELLANFKFDTTKFPFTPHFNPFRSMPGNDTKKPNEGEEKSGTNSTDASKEAHDSVNVSERPSAENLRESLSFYRFSEANIRAVCQGPGNAEKLLGASKNEPMSDDERHIPESPHELEYRSDDYMQRQRGRRTASAGPPKNAKQRNSNGSSRSKSSMIRRKVSGNFFPKTAGDRWKVFVESRGTSTDNSVRPRYQPVYQQKQQQEQQQQARRRMSRLHVRQASDKGTSTSAERSKMGKKSNAPARHTEIGLEEEGIAQRIIGDDIRTSRMPVMDEDQGQNMQEPGRQPEVVAEKQQIIRRSQGEANTGPIKQESPVEANPQRVDVSQQTREDTRGQGDATGSTQRSETPADRRSNSMENRTSDGQKRASQGVAAELKPPARPPRQRIDLSTIYRRNDSNARGFYNFLNLYRQRNPLLSYSASKKMASEIYRQLDPNTKKYYYRMRTFVRRVESVDPVLETLAAAKLASDLVPDSSFTSRAEALRCIADDPRNVTSGEFDENRECLNLLKRCRSVGYMNYLEEYRNRNRDVPFTKAIKVSAAIYLYLSKSAKQRYRAMSRRSRALKPECEEKVVEEVPISMTVRFSDSGSIEINATSDILNNFADDDECYDGCDSSDSSSDVLDAESEADEEDEKEKDEDLSDDDNDEDNNCDEDPDDNRADDERADDDESNEDQDSSSCSDAVANLGHVGVSSFLEALRDKKLRNRFESNSYDADKSSSVSSCRDHEESESDIRTGYENDNGAELDVQSSKSSQITCNSFSGVSSIDILQEIEDEEMEDASDEDDDDDETEKEEDEQDDYATCQNSDSEYEHCELEDGEESDGSNRDNGEDDNHDDDDNDDHDENRDNEPLPVNTADRIAAAAAFARSLSAKRKNIRSNEQLDSETSTMQTMTNHHCDKCHNELKELPNINRQQKRVRVGQCPICEKIFCYRK